MGSRKNSNKTIKVYSQEFQALLDRLEEEDNRNDELMEEEDDEDEEDEELGNGSKRSRRRKLSSDQVKALEKKFEAEHRLGQPRKAAIAAELGLEQRQVAVWFQNRRARCKSKKLEDEFSRLQADYAALRQNYDSLQRETDSLVAEVKELEAKVEAKESIVKVDPSTSAMVTPGTMEMLFNESSPPPMSPWWSGDEAYVANQEGGFLVNGELGGVITSSTSTWDEFSSFDQTYFW
ncbi:hypothetical protein V2J09_008134 [Rumex salicifolius]